MFFNVGRSASSTALGDVDACGSAGDLLSAGLVFMVSDESVWELVGEAPAGGSSSFPPLGSSWVFFFL